VIFVVANFLQVFWRKTLKNVGFWQKLAPTLLKQKKWQKGKNTDLNTLPYPFVTQCFFGVASYFKFCKNVLMEKLENCVCYGIKCAKIHHFCEIRKWRKNQNAGD
jgi:hypothetical protein